MNAIEELYNNLDLANKKYNMIRLSNIYSSDLDKLIKDYRESFNELIKARVEISRAYNRGLL